MSPPAGGVVRCAFNALPAAVRRRVVAVAQRDAKEPVVLARDLNLRVGWFKYVLLVVALGATGAILSELLRPSACREPQFMQETYAMLAAALAVAWMAGLTIARRFLAGPAPYAEGRYVFPSGLLKLDGGEVEFVPLPVAGAPKVVTHRRNHSYTHTTVDFAFPWSFTFDRGEEARAAAQAMVDALNGLVPPTAADPFAACVAAGTFTAPSSEASEPPLHHAPPRALGLLRFPGGLVVGAGVAAALYAFCAAG